MRPDPWARGTLIAVAHLLLPILCARRWLELLHQDGRVTRTCVDCGRTVEVPTLGGAGGG